MHWFAPENALLNVITAICWRSLRQPHRHIICLWATLNQFNEGTKSPGLGMHNMGKVRCECISRFSVAICHTSHCTGNFRLPVKLWLFWLSGDKFRRIRLDVQSPPLYICNAKLARWQPPWSVWNFLIGCLERISLLEFSSMYSAKWFNINVYQLWIKKLKKVGNVKELSH